jgi:hypothetical protein
LVDDGKPELSYQDRFERKPEVIVRVGNQGCSLRSVHEKPYGLSPT